MCPRITRPTWRRRRLCARNNMIKLKSVTKLFPDRGEGPVAALDKIDLAVSPGEFVAVTGPSGSGKSTMLFAIGGMLEPTEGSVELAGTDVYSLSYSGRAALRRTRIGFVFQTFNLIPYLSCLENVCLPAMLAGGAEADCVERAEKLLKELGLGHRLSHRPAELSVGERQRAALCRIVINDPEVILADEPTGNLDPGITEEVMRILLSLNAKGHTIVMATHNLHLAGKCSRVVALDKGRVQNDGQPGGGVPR